MRAEVWGGVEQYTKVEIMLRKGASMREIGAAMHVTRNAVSGRIHRDEDLKALAEKSRADKAPPKNTIAHRPLAQRRRTPVPSMPAPQSQPTSTLPAAAPAGIAPPKMWLTPLLHVRGCKWPAREAPLAVGGHLFCDAPTGDPFATYCPYHEAIARPGGPRKSESRRYTPIQSWKH